MMKSQPMMVTSTRQSAVQAWIRVEDGEPGDKRRHAGNSDQHRTVRAFADGGGIKRGVEQHAKAKAANSGPISLAIKVAAGIIPVPSPA